MQLSRYIRTYIKYPDIRLRPWTLAACVLRETTTTVTAYSLVTISFPPSSALGFTKAQLLASLKPERLREGNITKVVVTA